MTHLWGGGSYHNLIYFSIIKTVFNVFGNKFLVMVQDNAFKDSYSLMHLIFKISDKKHGTHGIRRGAPFLVYTGKAGKP